jgi:hypothetical protein
MRFSRRVVQTAALIRDRPAGVVKSATRARRQRLPSSAYATPFRLAARTPPKSIRDPHRPVPVAALVPNALWYIVVLHSFRVSPPACISHGTLHNRRVT